jgi:hypothetical protein
MTRNSCSAPSAGTSVKALIIQMARENRAWGHRLYVLVFIEHGARRLHLAGWPRVNEYHHAALPQLRPRNSIFERHRLL